MMAIVKRYGTPLIFTLLVFLMIAELSSICRRKGKTWDFTSGFWAEPENSLDLVCIGSSHSYCSWNPNVAKAEGGFDSYSFGSPSQPIEASYAFIREVFRHQRPKVILLETFAMIAADPDRPIARLAAHNATDQFDFGRAKTELIDSMNLAEGRENYYFDLLQYHSRWKELSKTDFTTVRARQENRGYQALKSVVPIKYIYWEADKIAWDAGINGHLAMWLDRIQRYVEAQGSELVVFTAPYNMNLPNRRFVKALTRFFKNRGIRYYNLADKALGLEMDGDKDFYDDKDGHLNVYGAEKMTRFLAKRLVADGVL